METIAAIFPNLSEDALGHESIANSLYNAVQILDPGVRICIQGPWGSGKTDILKRFANRVRRDSCLVGSNDLHAHQDVYWVNPWESGEIATPIVREILARRSVETNKAFFKHCKNFILHASGVLVRAGAARFLDGVLPGAGLASLLKDIDKFEKNLTSDDRMSAVGEVFRELVDQVLKQETAERGMDRMIICIDDLDRCLPPLQVAVLESLFFITSCGARATFIVALDDRHIESTLQSHYSISNIDSHGYLNKLFDLRQNVPRHSTPGFIRMTAGLLSEQIGQREPRGQIIQRGLGLDPREIASSFVTLTPDIRQTPRDMRRLVDKLVLLACQPPMPVAQKRAGSPSAHGIVSWLLLNEFHRSHARLSSMLESPAEFTSYISSAEQEIGKAPANRKIKLILSYIRQLHTTEQGRALLSRCRAAGIS